MAIKRSLLIAGVDEAGRGPLAGSVYAAAVILDPARPIVGLNDSKRLSPQARERLFDAITTRSLAFAIAFSDVAEIAKLNILHASLQAMRRAVDALDPAPAQALIDGLYCPPEMCCPATAVVRGDSKVPAISAASILAKVARDRDMQRLDALYPVYGFAQHKGYPTRAHIAALELHGACPIHRVSFAPVRRVLKLP